MIVFVLDSDGLIKLTKASVIEVLAEYRKCVITQEVFNEAVKAGKERFYEDAYIIEDLINRRLLTIKKVKFTELPELGKGEASSLEILKKGKYNAIITDDRKFLKMLEGQNIPFVMPSDVIIALLKRHKITTKKASEALEKIRPFIRKEIYERAKKEVEI